MNKHEKEASLGKSLAFLMEWREEQRKHMILFTYGGDRDPGRPPPLFETAVSVDVPHGLLHQYQQFVGNVALRNAKDEFHDGELIPPPQSLQAFIWTGIMDEDDIETIDFPLRRLAIELTRPGGELKVEYSHGMGPMSSAILEGVPTIVAVVLPISTRKNALARKFSEPSSDYFKRYEEEKVFDGAAQEFFENDVLPYLRRIHVCILYALVDEEFAHVWRVPFTESKHARRLFDKTGDRWPGVNPELNDGFDSMPMESFTRRYGADAVRHIVGINDQTFAALYNLTRRARDKRHEVALKMFKDLLPVKSGGKDKDPLATLTLGYD